MAKFFNRARMTTATVGTGTMTLGSAVSNAFLTFAEAGVVDTDVVAYCIEDGTDFESGIGTYTSAGTTLSRTTVRVSKIAGVAGTTKITLSGNATVFISPAKEDLSTTVFYGWTRFATAAEYRAAGADTLGAGLSPANVWSAADLVTLTDASPIAVDMSLGLNFIATLNVVGATRQLGNPTNTKNGQTGVIIVNQDGSGSRLLTYGTNWEFAGGLAFTLSTAAGAKDLLFYFVQSSTSIILTGILKAVV